MIKKIIYFISIISILLLSFLILEMLSFIYESGWQGFLFLLVVIITLMVELYFLIYDKKLMKKSWTYNIFIILATMYLSLIYYKIYSITELTSSIYEFNINYCKDNYLVLTIVFVLILVNIIIIKRTSLKEKNL